jgi:hypothetical protein
VVSGSGILKHRDISHDSDVHYVECHFSFYVESGTSHPWCIGRRDLDELMATELLQRWTLSRILLHSLVHVLRKLNIPLFFSLSKSKIISYLPFREAPSTQNREVGTERGPQSDHRSRTRWEVRVRRVWKGVAEGHLAGFRGVAWSRCEVVQLRGLQVTALPESNENAHFFFGGGVHI